MCDVISCFNKINLKHCKATSNTPIFSEGHFAFKYRLYLKGRNNDYFIGSKDFIIQEVAMFSLCHSMFLFFSWKFILKPQMKKLLLRPE
jgi:hypothetical protein